MRSLSKVLVVCTVSLIVSGCSVLDILTPPQPDPIVCQIAEHPTLPPMEDGQVVLQEDDAMELLLYIESLEDCVDKIK